MSEQDRRELRVVSGIVAGAEYSIEFGIAPNLKARFMADDGTPGAETNLDFCACIKTRRPRQLSFQ